MANIKNIVNSKWLSDHLMDDDLVILEVFQTKNKAGLESAVSGSISRSIRVELKSDFSDPKGRFPNTFPTAKQFEITCNKLGISNNSKVIIVDRLGVYNSPRLWFLFKAMGHDNVAILNGGIPAWLEDGFVLEDTLDITIPKENYSAKLQTGIIKTFSEIAKNIKSQNSILIDARSSNRFLSLEQEPRPEIRNGNIPNSINIPYKSLLEGNRYKPVKELSVIFSELQLSNKSLIFSCGSGVTACIVMLAAELVNNNPKSIYDGSWTEWATLIKD